MLTCLLDAHEAFLHINVVVLPGRYFSAERFQACIKA